jgi:serine phosphatase RsbU (regulator of sigma subunit)/Tfp pilus assembly protein PilF
MHKLRATLTAVIIFFLSISTLLSQNARIDSLKKYVETAQTDTNLVKTTLDLAFGMRLSDPAEGMKYALKGKKMAEDLGWKVGEAKAFNTMGSIYKAQSEYPKALESYQKALSFFEGLNRKKEIATVLMNIGSVYRPLHQYDKALEYYKKALPIAKEVNARKLQGQLLGNMGVVYFATDKFEDAKVVEQEALAIFREVGDKENQAWILSNTADLHCEMGDYEKALNYQDSAIVIYDELGILSFKSGSLGNKGHYYYMMALKEKDPAKKKELLHQSVEKYKQAIEILVKVGEPDYLKDAYMNIAQTQSELGDYKSALENYVLYTQLKDSVFSMESQESIAKLETKRELEVRDKEIVIEQLKKRTERTYMFAGVVFLLVIIGFIAAGYRGQKRSKEVISKQKQIVEEKQKEIVDSINYAKRIQYALLAHDDFIRQHLPSHFVLFKPKDIVSGDFYWATSYNDKFYLAVCDSTGHGVPGAFMSLLSISYLNEAINEKKISSPDKVFNFVRSRLIEISGESQKDGFDGTLMCFDLKNKSVSYASANNSPLLIREGKIIKLETDRMPVGAGEKKGDFRLFNMELMSGDRLYMYTDGFSDQFGGPEGKKFLSKNLQNFLLETSNASPQEQSAAVLDKFNSWKGNHEQVDDVTVVGIRI